MSGVSFMERLLDGVEVAWKQLDDVGEFRGHFEIFGREETGVSGWVLGVFGATG